MRMTWVLLLGCLAPGAPLWAADLPGSADHPLIPRYQDAEILKYTTQAFAEYRLLVAPAKAYGGLAKNLGASQALEGKLTQIHYRAPAERTALEVYRNYQQALEEAGFEILFACATEACGGRNFNHAVTTEGLLRESQQSQQYLAARRTSPQGEVYAALYVAQSKSGGANQNRTLVQLAVLEPKPLEQRMQVLEAGALQRDLDGTGKVALYGLPFDFDQDRLRANAQPQLEEIAKLLKASPQLQVLVVGHTDAKGALDYNRELSQRRAHAIVEALAGAHGIARARLSALGVGMAAPVASNRTEEGRALNRRVELVERGE
ncbi:MAG: DUF4892 domain-containing protein [Pseudomonas sp.]